MFLNSRPRYASNLQTKGTAFGTADHAVCRSQTKGNLALRQLTTLCVGLKPKVGSEESNELPFNSKDQGWSEWSAWSSCSRSCNGGVSHQIRKCERKSGCEGETTKYKICNMQVSRQF
ncbi:hypothetical protein TNCT_38891 [Trichonephila clavata]|uniref:Uncharacterized protein n=1 Tax=Trichonephila clavata TaxID=2740835 RepID=A0A8X6KWI4_TRICU|nr:hypothetical protein TNCT_38891 [Trichonephila clavata]